MQESHIQEKHSSVFCECGAEMEARLLEGHKSGECPQRQVKCSFCQLRMAYRELWAHEKECGAKTEKCDACGAFVRIR